MAKDSSKVGLKKKFPLDNTLMTCNLMKIWFVRYLIVD